MSIPVKTPIKINFSGALDTKTDAFQISPENFLALNNSTFTTGGQLTKRNGFPSLGKTINSPNPALTYSNVGGTVTSARKVFSYNDELLLNDPFNLYSYDSANNAWTYKGRSTMVSIETNPIVSGANAWIEGDMSMDLTTGIKVYAYYSTSLGVYYSIQDIATGQILVNQAVLGSTYVNPRCISISGKSWILAVNTSDQKLYYQAIVGQTVTGSPTALITNLHTKYTFTVSAANATAGATYTNNGNTFTVLTTIAGGTTLVTSGTGPPAASGTLTKTSGTGDATITFSAFSANLATAQQYYDIDVDSLSGNIYIAYFNNADGITISALSTSLVVGNTITKTESASNGLSWFGDGSNIWVVYNNGSATKGFIVNNAVSSTVLAPTVIDSGATAANVNNVTGVYSSTQSKAFVFYDPYTSSGGITSAAVINFNTMTVLGVVGTPTLFMGSVMIHSRAFAVSGIPHIIGINNIANVNQVVPLSTVIQPTDFLLNLYNVTPSMGGSSHNDVVANIAAKINPDEALASTVLPGRIKSIHQDSSSNWNLALFRNVNFGFEEAPTPILAPTGLINCQFDFSYTNPDVQVLGNNALIAGGQVSMYDGANVVEQNFHIYPGSATSVVLSTGAGSSWNQTADALYSYIFTYEWIDNQGQLHRSFPSPVTTPKSPGHNYTFASTDMGCQVVLTIPTLRVTNKGGSQVAINVYRTIANGSVYFLIGTIGGLLATYPTAVNDPAAASITVTDTYADSVIEGNIQLYTTGALGYYAPPATKALTNFKNRAIQVSSEDPFQVGYSNAVLQNFPVQFVPEFLQNIGTVGGALVTVAQMDDKMLFFKDGKNAGPAIYYMVGQGPAPSGANNDFQDPLPVAVDVGCVDRPSVVLTPIGVMFKSNKGIYLLSRSLEAIYIGAPVEAFNQYTVLSAQLIPNTTQVRFLISNGVMLVYDYFYKQWGTYSPPAGISDCIFQGQHTYVASDGTVYKESPGTYYDGTNTPVLMNFTSAWFKLAGLQGYQRAYFLFLLGQYISAHQLTVTLYTNFSTSADSTVTITPNSAQSLENWRVFFAKQRCQSFQVKVQEVSTGTLGASLTLSGMNLIAGVKGPFRTISAANSTG